MGATWVGVDTDAWADGQIASKLWLCETLERLPTDVPSRPTIWILGGWYAQTAFLLFARDRLRPGLAYTIDHDPHCEEVARHICNHMEVLGIFRAKTGDANQLDFNGDENSPAPHIVINTAVEHFRNNLWFHKVKSGTIVAVQATDMDNWDHHNKVTDIKQMEKMFPMEYLYYRGTKTFVYPDKTFTRYMLIGRK